MIPILTFYMLKDWDKIESFFETIFSKINKPKWITVFSKINKKLGDYVKGQLLICSILACLYSVIFSFLGISVSIECGVFTGMLSFIPFFGPFIGCLTTLSAMVSDVSQSYQYIAIILSYLIIPIIDSNFLTPKLIGAKTGIPPVWLLFSIFSMVSILGTIGIIIAVPLSIVLSTICKEIIENFKAR